MDDGLNLYGYTWFYTCNETSIITIGPKEIQYITISCYMLKNAIIHPGASCHNYTAVLDPLVGPVGSSGHTLT